MNEHQHTIDQLTAHELVSMPTCGQARHLGFALTSVTSLTVRADNLCQAADVASIEGTHTIGQIRSHLVAAADYYRAAADRLALVADNLAEGRPADAMHHIANKNNPNQRPF